MEGLIQSGLTQTAQSIALKSAEGQNPTQQVFSNPSIHPNFLVGHMIPQNKYSGLFQRVTFYASYVSLFGLASWLFDGVPSCLNYE